MKLRTYDQLDKGGKAENKKPGLKIYSQQIVLYPELTDLLDVKVNERVKFAQDMDKPGDWYICKDNENGVLVRKYGKTSACSVILRAVSKTVPPHWLRQMILVGTTPVEQDGVLWYPLITAALNNTESIFKQLAKDNTEKPSARDQY